MGHSVFISYRRDGGEAMAQLLHDRLVQKGFDVFYDIESLKSGPFDTKLLSEIQYCDYFVLVLPPQGLDRCRYEEDWVRQEIRHALRLNKPIVPVMMRGFEFPADLPDDIARVSKCNGVRFDDMNYLDAKINKIIDLFDQSAGDSARYTGDSHRRSGPAMISNVCSIGGMDPKNPWPQGKYSPIVSIDAYNVIYFHATLTKPFGVEKTATVGYFIYNDEGTLLREDQLQLSFAPQNNRFSIGWIIKGDDGSFVKAGRYRAELWIENSRVFEYNFKLTSREQEEVRREVEARHGVVNGEYGNVRQSQAAPALMERITELQKNLSRPKGLLYALGFIISYFAAQFGADDGSFLVVLGVVAMLVCLWMMYKYTRKYVKDSFILAVLMILPGFPIYLIYLAVTTIFYFQNKDNWQKELDALLAIV